MVVLFFYIGQMPFLAPSLDNADPLFVLVITPGFCLHHVVVVDQDPASGSLYAEMILYIILFQERWFKLHANLLFYFKTNEFGALADPEPIGVLVIVGHTVQMETYVDQPFVFSISFNAGDDSAVPTKLYFRL